MNQIPGPGSRMICSQGDTISLTLKDTPDIKGRAYVRTNIGHASVRRMEIIGHVDNDSPALAMDWHDMPMSPAGDGSFSIAIPLIEPGRYEAKTFFLADNAAEPEWPAGDNVIIKVEPAENVCSNTIYNAFIRQFRPGMERSSGPEPEKKIAALEKNGYSVIPLSGKFRNLVKELDFIVGKLRCRIIQVLPPFPVPTTYGRMGLFGSPFASMDFMDVDPSMAVLDRKTTPMGQFRELIDEIHRRHARIIIDLPANHTGWGSKLQNEHPEWFPRDKDRSFESPGAWGVTWEDLSELDYKHRGLWRYMAEVFLFWCAQGVDGFRCDAGYMVPGPAWEYIIARVRDRYPLTIFLLEGLGGPMQKTESLIGDVGMNWAYSELFQNYDRTQIENYLPDAWRISNQKGLLVHFSETHDNNRLASVSHGYSAMRMALCALCSVDGAFGFANGAEWLAAEKIQVHDANPLNWGSKVNQVDFIARLNALMEVNPCFHHGCSVEMVQVGPGNFIAVRRGAGDRSVTAVINLNHDRACTAAWRMAPDAESFVDLLSGSELPLSVKGGMASMDLAPGQVLCISSSLSDLQELNKALAQPCTLPDRVLDQLLKTKALEVLAHRNGGCDFSDCDLPGHVDNLSKDPMLFLASLYEDEYVPVVRWKYPADLKRELMIPPGHYLLFESDCDFTARSDWDGLHQWGERAMKADDGSYFALFVPSSVPQYPETASVELTVFEKERVLHRDVPLMFLSEDDFKIRTVFDKQMIQEMGSHALCTNGRGAMSFVRGAWASIESQYDCLLGGNLHGQVPVDRHIMFTRCRAWIVYRGYSQEVDLSCQRYFSTGRAGAVKWGFDVPVGQGLTIPFEISLNMQKDHNRIDLGFERITAGDDPHRLADENPVRLILRPDVEDRNFHCKTKAYSGPESVWRTSVSARAAGYDFRPASDRILSLEFSNGKFVPQQEWVYMVSHAVDAERGLDGSSDLFSPGYFEVMLKGDSGSVLSAAINEEITVAGVSGGNDSGAELYLREALTSSVGQYVVKRDEFKTVIAGYPWFLDWGRDTLICLRGMISAGMLDESVDILCQFARFEKAGTLPNMIRGLDDSNRDTSDAPLWFITGCADVLKKAGSDFLSLKCGNRTVMESIKSIGEGYIRGTPNGIRMDPDSGLIFSPSHYTWMDTNHPAGTPREGYPVEIQALWFSSLNFLSEIDPSGIWKDLAERVKSSILKMYLMDDSLNGGSYLSDCLHAVPGESAADARRDDHLRPNQLLAVTLGAVTDREVCRLITSACSELLVPGAIRSLADRPVTYNLEVTKDGRILNDPQHPYFGRYEGDEDTRRKPAYHNGTAWSWMFPSYPEALFMTFGESARAAALSVLGSSVSQMNSGCAGHIPEITDGDYPHRQRGCGAQAWGATEFLRVYDLLSSKS